MISDAEVWDQAGDKRLSVITAEVENPVFNHIAPGGYGTLTFDTKRDPRFWYSDLKLTNILKVFIPGRSRPVWEGEITNLPRRMSPDPTQRGLLVEASGLVNWMRNRINTAPFASGLISDWMTANMMDVLGYAWLPGNPYPTDEFSFTDGLDVAQYKRFYDLVMQANLTMNWDWGVGLITDGKPQFYFRPFSETPDYYVDYEDCESDMDYAVDGIENVIRYKYTDLLEAIKTGWYPNDGNPANAMPDQTSLDLYRRRDGEFAPSAPINDGTAVAMMAAQHGERKGLRPASSVKAWNVYGADGLTLIPPEETESGKVLFIRGLFPATQTREQAQRVNEMSTFRVCEAKVTSHEGYVEFAPAAVASNLAMMLAQLDALKKK